MDKDTNKPQPTEAAAKTKVKKKPSLRGALGGIYELVEMLGTVTVAIILIFAFVVRVNIVDGQSMDHTLADGQYLAVSNLFYEPAPGDIAIIHKISAYPYNEPLVKRIIAVEGQTVDIDFSTWTLTVDGEVIDEPYRYLADDRTLTADYSFPITVGENEVFVMGDNRNHSADSRTAEIGLIDKRCVVGKAYVRMFPLTDFTIFENPRIN